ncbi:hypothetical protein KIN20_000119 [Parelaphostrongylus tenuis]|uniref:Uncharacterized protein n=1 Tax=Parelaphostrongylus tenuis TaxID=148309 RepID=A0AAD5MD70_PARTN|nr:hypothetical protein KIN20_000119 [Parelaphostrongylus tenuis]
MAMMNLGSCSEKFFNWRQLSNEHQQKSAIEIPRPQSFPNSVMVWVEISATGNVPLVSISKYVGMSAVSYQEQVLRHTGALEYSTLQLRRILLHS